jgi:hypothetical protein
MLRTTAGRERGKMTQTRTTVCAHITGGSAQIFAALFLPIFFQSFSFSIGGAYILFGSYPENKPVEGNTEDKNKLAKTSFSFEKVSFYSMKILLQKQILANNIMYSMRQNNHSEKVA